MMNRNAIQVSIIMASYNAEEFIGESIESVLAQTFTDFELIIVDDGSKDSTRVIIEEYKKKDARIVSIYKDNSGPSDARNCALAVARGKYIAILDSDDISVSDRIVRQYQFMEKHKDIVLVGSGCQTIDEYGKTIGNYEYHRSSKLLKNDLLKLRKFFPHSSAFYRRETALEVGGYLRKLKQAEDYRLWLDLSQKGRISSIRGKLVKVRKHKSSLSYEFSGRNQNIHAMAISVSYFVHQYSQKDPFVDYAPYELEEFVQWIDNKCLELGIYKTDEVLLEAKNVSSNCRCNIARSLVPLMVLLKRGELVRVVGNKVLGSSYSRRLAKRWVIMYRSRSQS